MSRIAIFACAGFFVGTFAALGSCLGDPASDCLPGTFACACVSGACQVGLTCVSNYCIDANAPMTTTLDGETGSADTDDPGMMVPGGPIIEEFVVDKQTLTNLQVLTFTAVVTDPDGLEDIKSGQIKTPTWDGSFFMNVGGATWSVVLDWQSIHDSGDLLGTEIEFTAEFTDQANLVAAKSVTVLVCQEDASPCPDGECYFLDFDDENCGSCGQDCSGGYCEDGDCMFNGDGDGDW